MSRLYINDPDQWASGYYRAKLPVWHCFHRLASENIQLVLDSDLQSNEVYYHSYMIHRMPSDTLLSFVKKVKEEHDRKIVWGLDDALDIVPPHMPNASHFDDKSRLNLMANMADKVVVTTPALAARIKQPDKILELPNLVDPSSFAHDKQPLVADEPLRILWCGSMFHEHDINILVDPIIRLISEYGYKIRFIFWGDMPDVFTGWQRNLERSEMAVATVLPIYEQNISYIRRLEFRYYFDQLIALRPHIALAPLQDNEFNSCKSNLKFLELTMGGAALIASDVEPYNCIKHGETGLLVGSNKPVYWYDAIKTLIEDRSLMKKLQANAQEDVLANHSWYSEQKRNLWLDAFRDMAS